MRERLTVAFVAVTLLLLVGAGLVRSYVVTGQVREQQSQHAAYQARTVGAVVTGLVARGRPVDEAALDIYATDTMRVTYTDARGATVVVAGEDFEADEAGGTEGDDDVVTATAVVGRGVLTVDRMAGGVGLLGGEWRSALVLFVLLAVVAGLMGYLVARALSAPFRQLARAAEALGRGRFDLDLPDTSMPEVRAIAQALDSSAAQLQERLEREREFGLHTSHVLRTPLTGLRLRLEELLGDPHLSPQARDAALACLRAVGQLSEVAGELVEISGRGVLVAGAAIPLRDLAAQVAQRWADVLDEEDRLLTAAVEGDIELPFTPGPVEQVLDLVLDDVVRHDTGGVRLVFEGAASSLRVDITCTDEDGGPVAPSRPVVTRVHAVLKALGGRVEAPPGESCLRVHLPRR